MSAYKIQPGKGLVAAADELGTDMLKAGLEHGIIFRGSVIDHISTTLFELAQQRQKDIVISLVFGVDHEGDRRMISFGGFAAAKKRFHFQQSDPQHIAERADHADQHGKKHTSGPRVDV